MQIVQRPIVLDPAAHLFRAAHIAVTGCDLGAFVVTVDAALYVSVAGHTTYLQPSLQTAVVFQELLWVVSKGLGEAG